MTAPRREVCQRSDCRRAIEYHPRTFTWRHVTPGIDHPPAPPKVSPAKSSG